MGSGISGNYDEITPIFTLGYWKVHSALTKEKHEAVSLWLLDFDRIKADAKSRSERNKYIESCLYSIQTMKQLDHPNILKILVANENLSDLAFAAEPVAFSLENNLNYSNDEVYYICDQLSNLASYLSNEKNLVSFHFYPGSFAFTSKFILKLCLFNFTSVIIGQQGQTVPRQIWSKSKLGSPLNYTAPEYSNN
ncbi:hypothetical protein TRFO_11376 [Tritrichomonas foetus]|uniref:Protein kinase domain-containing protein n=1 Tax=Tritrichomonas foetus TaxID=1144522 RepID=A0A1J4J3S6_9EUKA|nr:hypothetical protein TRFO_11376 [Tritrichomonas foetus]|eukprot:OHS94104.1 hypothetical protein TRFO_11376 [Tritrichomonas foetus]